MSASWRQRKKHAEVRRKKDIDLWKEDRSR
jgi:hypothetical protein